MKRQIALDTETTGLDPKGGHRIIEIGCIELINRRVSGETYHQYINPQRDIELGAEQVHGLSNEFLADKPTFTEIVDDFIAFVDGAELIIHNVPFDVGFINHEFSLLNSQLQPLEKHCRIIDTLPIARKLHPGQRNSLDALCKRYQIDNSNRSFHGGLLDARLLAFVYLAMTSGQHSLFSSQHNSPEVKMNREASIHQQQLRHYKLKVVKANSEELTAHEARLDAITAASGMALWRAKG